MRCQGYQFEEAPSDHLQDLAFRSRLKWLGVGKVASLYGKFTDSFLAGIDKFMLPGVEVKIRLVRASHAFTLIESFGEASNSPSKRYATKILKASLHVHKLELRPECYQSIERALKSHAAVYDYRDMTPVTFIINAGTSVFRRGDSFDRAPIKRMVMCLLPEKSFTGHYNTNPYHFQRQGMSAVRITRDGLPVGGTPLDTTDEVKTYYSTMDALDFTDGNSNGLTLERFKDHYMLVFKLTADLNVMDSSIRPEVTGGRLGIETVFEKPPLEQTLRLICFGERRSNVYIDKEQQVIKNSLLTNV